MRTWKSSTSTSTEYNKTVNLTSNLTDYSFMLILILLAVLVSTLVFVYNWHTGCVKSSRPSLTRYRPNFDKRWTNFHNFFTVKFRKKSVEEDEIKNYHLPSNLLLHYLVKSKWTTVQLYSTANSVQSDEKMFNYGKCSQRMLCFCFSTQTNFRHRHIKLCVFWVVNATGQWMRQMCVVQCCAKLLSS